MDDLLNEFLTETSESIAIIDVELVNLEKDPEDQEILSKIFRLVHTIKGTCGFLGLPRLEELAHAGEDVLGKIRDGEMGVSPETVTLILSSIDRIKENLDYIEENEKEPAGDDKDLIVQLRALAAGEAINTSSDEELPEEENVADDSEAPVTSDDGFPIAAEFLAEFEEATASSAVNEEEINEEEVVVDEDEDEITEENLVAGGEDMVENLEHTKEEDTKVPVLVEDEKKQVKVSKKQKESSVADQSIRVNVDLLENLMTLVSELVLTRNQLLQMVRDSSDSEFAAPLQSLSHITTDLQEGVMKTRMQPVGNAWAKLPRIVRDLSIESGKKIELQMIGADTELDRQVLELIKDPLTHMVRNSADHGLETTEERIAVGKPDVGVIVLNAYHEGGHIIIEINDDGKGLNIGRIRKKAIENGLATEAELETMADHQVAQFVFRAGFSTAEKITSVSGRGVGMDVVRTNIEKIGRSVELKTVDGKGTSFIIKIPLTLAIVSALVVASSSERFAIPQISVLELVRVTENSEFSIENLNASPVLRLRDRLLPLVNLADLLQLDKEKKDEVKAEGEDDKVETEETFIVVSQVGTYTFGIIVDRVFDTEEIVVKPVAPILRHITMFSGNTILGDGSVIMILDPNGIASAAGEVATTSDSMTGMEKSKKTRTDESTSLLVFRAGGNNLKAVPLNLVARLEEIKIED
ncbi:MAG: chemotaxis protein CheA, partial [Alphaproteobacteria bacterium]|nr:chemotaxis protein CheA [Alphaproteobacteria bacterium]